MPAAITDKFTKASNGTRPVPTTLTATRAVGAASITCGALTGWNTDTAEHFIIYNVDTAGNKVAGSQVDCKGIVSGNTITSIQYKAGSDVGHPVGAVVEAAPTAAWADDLASGLTTQHNQDGTHKSLTTDTLTTTGNVTIGGSLTIGGSSSGGWEPISGTISAVTNNGNRSYDLTTSASNAALISPGMRLRTTRTVAAPTQATSLNGTNQYWQDTTVSGMTFTDDFVVGAWVKLSAYQTNTIASRYNGTSGWILYLNSTGQVVLVGHNAGAGNQSVVTSYQSLPLNKWVHVTAQLDMSAFTATPTTSYIMIDGVDVPASVTRFGTNPTALVQAGNLEIGSYNNGTAGSFFNGKIAQAFVSSAKITQANIRTLMTQGLTSALITANSIVSAYSFDGNANDLNTTNANNLTAQNGATATNADSPFGGQAGGTISSTLDYGIVQKVTASTITVQVAEGCTIPTSGGVASASYSTFKSPFGFPGQEEKWEIISMNRNLVGKASPTANIWYSDAFMHLNVPVGSWRLGYTTSMYGTRPAGANDVKVTLSASSTTEDDRNYTSTISANSSNDVAAPATIFNNKTLSTATTHYLLIVTAAAGMNAVYLLGDRALNQIKATNAYL